MGRHVHACLRRARRVLSCDEWVDDVVQVVFVDVWVQAHRFDPSRGSVRSWLLTLTHHKAVDVVRREERHASCRAQEDLLDRHIDSDPTPEQRVASTDVRIQVRAAVARVRSPLREAVELCFLSGLTQREAAERLDIPLGTVKTRSQRALLELRDLVEPGLADSA